MPTMPPIHPGEILLEEFLQPLSISQYRLAKDISVPPRRINEIVHGKRAISADTALQAGALLWNHRSILAQSADTLQFGVGERSPR